MRRFLIAIVLVVGLLAAVCGDDRPKPEEVPSAPAWLTDPSAPAPDHLTSKQVELLRALYASAEALDKAGDYPESLRDLGTAMGASFPTPDNKGGS